VAEIRAALAPGTPVEVWFQDEMRVGQKNKLTYRWARKGSRPRAAHDQRTQSTYLLGAVCPERGAGAALVLPACNGEAMQLHLDEIATKVAPGAYAVLLLDQAGGHGAKALVVPSNISLVPLPPRAPELNGQENIWQFTRQNWLSNRIFKSFDDIVDHCCYAWNTLIDQLEDHVHRATRLGCRRSLNMRIGITTAIQEFDKALPDLAKMRNVGEHIDDYAADDPKRRHRDVGRGQLQVGSWDPPVFSWVGDLDIDLTLKASGELFVAVK
jgi:DDE superfamily endonuclease